MTVRMRASSWLKRTGRRPEKGFRASKYYRANEHPKKRPVWWFEFPETLVLDTPFDYLDLLCETGKDSGEFHHLRVPKGLFSACRIQIGFREDKRFFSIWLSAEETSLFEELRGTGRIDFGVFQI